MPRKTEIYLPEDMEVDILLRLPVKSLLRFRCVCKKWCTRFQNPVFITNHYLKQISLHNNNNNANISVLLHRNTSNDNDQDLLYLSSLDATLSLKENIHIPLPKYFLLGPKILGPCNGLICLWNSGDITLWNPATREYRDIPPCPPLAISTSFRNIGFGFDSKTDDYKVVSFIFDPCKVGHTVGQVHLYTLGTNSWREIPTVGYLNCGVYEFNFNTYINGVFHWKVFFGEDIITFDMADEVFSKLTLPFNNISLDYFWNLAILNESLAVIIYPQEGMEKSFDIWVMKEYGLKESWTKHLTIGPILGVERPLGFWKNGGLFLDSRNGQLVLYDPNTLKIEKVNVHFGLQTTWIVVNVESLVPINGKREHEDDHIIRLPTQMRDT